ncbi:MAG: hypothetical protein DMD34_15450 [Gemmatimonadetes bacterium]|nr:MAG: hypothetical protein DMD34_15450 [Gemmatimonadota bacterium]
MERGWVLDGDARFEVACLRCGAVLLLVDCIRDAEAATMAAHLRECHPELRLGATVGVGDVLDNYRVTPTR